MPLLRFGGLSAVLVLLSMMPVRADDDSDIRELVERQKNIQKQYGDLQKLMNGKAGKIDPAAMKKMQQGAQSMDGNSAKALQQTQDMLQDPAARQKAANETPEGRAAAAKVNSLSSDPQTQDAIYGLSSDIFKDLTTKANGDPEKMKKMLEQAMKDPGAFARSLSPEQRKKLRNIAESIDGGSGARK